MGKPSKNSKLLAGYTRRHVRVKRTPKGDEREVRFEKKGPKIPRIRKPGDMAAAQRRMWQAVLAAETLLLDADASRSDQASAVHALVQATAAYAKVLEVTDLAARVAELEETLKSRETPAMRRVG